MLHKGKLQAALNAKREQFSRHDNSFGEQLKLYQHTLESLYSDAVDAGKRKFRLNRDVAQGLQGKISVAVLFLRGFQNAEQGPGPSPAAEDNFVDENLFFGGKDSGRGCLHRHSSERAAGSYCNVAFFSESAPSLGAQ